MGEVQDMSVPLLVDLVNGWGSVPRARAGDRPRPSTDELVRRHAVPPSLAATFTAATLQEAADLLYPVFAAADPAERARIVTELLARTGVRPGLSTGQDGDIRATWAVARGRDVVLAAAAVTVRAQLAEHDPQRLGTCAARGCGDAFVDASPGAHRRFCSVTCQSRERVAAFRRRRRTPETPT